MLGWGQQFSSIGRRMVSVNIAAVKMVVKSDGGAVSPRIPLRIGVRLNGFASSATGEAQSNPALHTDARIAALYRAQVSATR